MSPRIAFYAPLKPPSHSVPSGDRDFARLLIRALRRGGFSVDLASRLRTRNADGDARRQVRIEASATRSLATVLRRYEAKPPDLWFTYHCYYKAPDLLGPAVAGRLGIPYVIAEGSHAPARLQGSWARGAALAEQALRRADLIFMPNPKDRAGLSALCPDGLIDLPPFLSVGRSANAETARRDWAQRLTIDPGIPWLIAIGMMRPGDKAQSYAVLADAVHRLPDARFHLLLVGDGAARPTIEALFASDHRVTIAGQLGRKDLRQLLVASDLFVWPAIGEAFGLAPLEAQAMGLPAVLGDRPGTRAMVRPDETALLAPEGDASAFADAIAALLETPARRLEMGSAARAHVLARHDLSTAATLLREHLLPLVGKA